MRAAYWAVARREIQEWRLALVVAFVLGLATLLFPLMPFSFIQDSEDLLVVLVIIVGGAFTFLLTCIVGAGLLSRELHAGGLAFYMTRPISGPVLWLGKLTGGALVVLLALLVFGAPAFLYSMATAEEGLGFFLENFSDNALAAAHWHRFVPLLAFQEGQALTAFNPPRVPELNVTGALGALGNMAWLLLLLAGTHVAATSLRTRNAWLIADIAGLALTIGVASLAVGRLVAAQAMKPLLRGEQGLVYWTLLCFLVAGALQLLIGRSDELRGRRILTMTLWPLLMVGALAFNVFASRTTQVTIDDLVSPTPRALGNGALLSGPTRSENGYRASFWLASETGESFELGPEEITRWHLQQRDSRLLWSRCAQLVPDDCEVWTADISGTPKVRATEIANAIDSRIRLSNDGRVAVAAWGWSYDQVRVHDLQSGKVLIAFQTRYTIDLSFDNAGNLWVFDQDPDSARVRIWRLEKGARNPEHVGDLPPQRGVTSIILHPVTSSILYLRRLEPEVGLYQSDGTLLASHPIPWRTPSARKRRAPVPGLRLLGDGRVVLVDTGSFVVLGLNGEIEHRIPLQDLVLTTLGGEIAPGRLLTGLITPNGGAVYELDANAGTLIQRQQGSVPLPFVGDGHGPATASPLSITDDGDVLGASRSI